MWSTDTSWMESKLISNKISSVLTILLSFRCIRKFSSMLRKIPKFKKRPFKTIEFHTEIHSISTHFNNKSSWNSSIMMGNNRKIKIKTIIKKLLLRFLQNLIAKILTNSFWIPLLNYKNIAKLSSNFKIQEKMGSLMRRHNRWFNQKFTCKMYKIISVE